MNRRIADNNTHISDFHDLMSFRVREILLVASSYDAFILEEDGFLADRILGEYLDMNLQFVPRVQHVNTAKEAFLNFQKRTYDLVIVMTRIADMDSLEFSRRIKERYPETYVVMLTFEPLNDQRYREIMDSKVIDRVFFWSGNDRLMLTIIKYVEDYANLEKDTAMGVMIILFIEDSPLTYSQLLPILYTEVMKQSQYLISQGVNNLHRLLRMRARPKILLTNTFEEAADILERYKTNILGIISDVSFEKSGRDDDEAGIKIAKRIREQDAYLPFLLYSDEKSNESKAQENGINFLYKMSPDLNQKLSAYISENYGFGNFIFRYPDGRVIGSTKMVSEFEEAIKKLPAESLLYHAKRHHFSRWFLARTEFAAAHEFRKMEVSDFKDTEELREFILSCIQNYYKQITKGKIVDFGLSKMNMENSFAKIGNGSIGGKGRGVAFFNSMLSSTDVFDKYTDLKIIIPNSVVLCSEVFEEFMAENDLLEEAVQTDNEEVINERFSKAHLPVKIVASLRKMINEVEYPIAVRSSSILEDSHMLPFAGIYKTYMLPNNNSDAEVRLGQLLDAIKLIYASVFSLSSKRYIRNANLRIEEEKMAVLIQKVVGQEHNGMYYPAVSGVAQSYNYYPLPDIKPEQGIVSLALGFGKIIVDGEQAFRFCPALPQKPPPYSSASEQMRKSQNYFYALNLSDEVCIAASQGCTYDKLGLERAEEDGVLKYVGSTYVSENDVIRDTLSEKGPRVITFSQILKYDLFPLADLIKDLFKLCKEAFGVDIEIEFVVNITDDTNQKIEFNLLQIRPIVSGRESEQVMIQDIAPNELLCSSKHAIGNGVFDNIYDMIFVDIKNFSISESKRIADEIGQLNQMLLSDNRKCILMGFGRLGTSDPWLGIPLEWSQMSQAKVVIEADTDNLLVDPSLGSHFYHNLVSLKMGYLKIGKFSSGEFIDWEWLGSIPAYKSTKHVKLIRLQSPLITKIDGRTGGGVIFKNNF